MNVLVPSDLLIELDGTHTARAAPPGCMRLLVTMWVLAGQQNPTRAELRALGHRARELWPSTLYARPGRITVLGVLLELERLGIVTGIEREATGFLVRVREERAA